MKEMLLRKVAYLTKCKRNHPQNMGNLCAFKYTNLHNNTSVTIKSEFALTVDVMYTSKASLYFSYNG